MSTLWTATKFCHKRYKGIQEIVIPFFMVKIVSRIGSDVPELMDLLRKVTTIFKDKKTESKWTRFLFK